MSQVLGGNCPPDDIPDPDKPGQWQIRNVASDGVVGPHLFYACPLGKGLCGVPCKPSPPNAKGCSWTWDGNTTEPTLTPSINCNGEGGCGWHGFMTKGELK